jgi:hypothetical protein
MANIDLHYIFKCSDADEDGIFSDDVSPFGEMDTNEFSQFIQHVEDYEIPMAEFVIKFNLPKDDKVIENASANYLQFYDDSDNGGYVVVFDGDIHYIYKP